MQLEEYFDFLAPDDIRIRGHRHGIEHVLHYYVFKAMTPEEIQRDIFPTLSLDQIYATILYYLCNRRAVDEYLTDWIEWGRRMRAEQAARADSDPVVQRLRKLKAERAAQS